MNEELLRQAREMHRAGRLSEALGAYRQLTAEEPEQAELWRLRAMAEHQHGRPGEARDSIRRAIDLQPQHAQAHLVLGHIAEDLDDTAQAEAAFRSATFMDPQWAPAWSALGTRLLDQGDVTEALACFQKAVELSPTMVRSWNNLGMAQLSLERIDDAVRAFNHAIGLDPRYALPHFNLARVHELRGEADRALASARQAVSLDPRHVDARLLVGDISRRNRDAKTAEESYAAAAALAPAATKPFTALADLYWEIGRVDQAQALYRQVESRHPGSYKAALGSRLLLPAVYDGLTHLQESRERYARGLEELHEITDRFHWKRPADALSEARWTNFYLAYQGGHDRPLQERFGDIASRVIGSSARQWMEPPARRAGAGRIRVGFFSYFFFNCTAGRYFASWIHGLDRERFESFVYYTNPWIADDTRAIAGSASTFRHLPGRPLDVIARQIRADQLDVLVYPELGMNSDTFTLATLRLATVQVAGWGHPTTSGLPSIDWFLSSSEMEPEGAQAHYSEKLALLPGLGTRYARPTGEEEGTRADFGLPDDKHLYLVPQSVFKIHPDNDALIAEVLAQDPQGRVVMFAANHDALTDRFVARVGMELRKRGLEVKDRLIFLPYMTHGAYLRLNRLCDVMLDTVHWSGGNTSLDALAGGLPVITLPGELMRGRQSLGMLRMLGVPELVATDRGDYVRRAVEIAREPERRAAASATILANLDRMFGREEPVRAFNDFLAGVGRL
ncbi:MAG TPA: tetratricopeptide repeat protein [Usitatibacter sp.]|nr:tetratricopeptide repeat protein [Usitatibacter sp.]